MNHTEGPQSHEVPEQPDSAADVTAVPAADQARPAAETPTAPNTSAAGQDAATPAAGIPPRPPLPTAQPGATQAPAAAQASAAAQAPRPTQAPTAGPAVPPPYTGAGQPGMPRTPQQPYAGAAPYGSPQPYGASFGAAAQNQTQPTLPIGETTTATAAPERKEKSGAGRIVALVLAAALVGGAAGLGSAYAGVSMWGASQPTSASGPATVTVNNTDEVTQTTAIAAKVVPSVVTISASAGSSGGGTGSGVILSEDGYVVTNTHVVTLDGATSDAALSVTTSDGKVYEAELVGLDPVYDLAVIKLVDASGLTPIEFADSSELNVGDQTVAVGAPLGLSNTVTTGIVSALNRSISIASAAAPDSGDSEQDAPQENGQEGPFYFDFGQGEQEQQQATSTISISVIQTDAAINPGNSGGALVDDEGNLIGINVAIATAGSSSESGSIGVGFSIPSNVVERVTSEIIETGSATHGLLGAMVGPAAAVEGSTTTGAYIDEVTDGGAAAAAGIQAGDIVTGFNDLPITDATDLTAQVRAAAAGEEVTLTVVRDGRTQTVEVTLGELTD